MRQRVILLCTLAALAAPLRASGQSATDAEQVTEIIRSMFAAVERGDVAALDTLYAADVTVVEGTGIDRGWTTYRDHHLVPELERFRDFQYRPSEIEAHSSGDHAWAIFRYSIRANMDERAIDAVGRGTAILERRAGRWVVLHTQTSSRARRPSDPEGS